MQEEQVQEAKDTQEEVVPEELPPLPQPQPKSIMTPRLKIALGVALSLVILAVIVAIFGPRRGHSPTPSPTATSTGVDLSRYSEDPDEDRIPSFIEEKLNFDPNISEIDRCYKTKCDAINQEEIERIPRNVMILLDSSGSMEQKVGQESKMASAKTAIREYLQKATRLPNTKVGLVIYGHKGSNKESDKSESCQSAETKVELGALNLQSVDQALAEVKPVGWTPIGLAIREAKKSFENNEKQNKENEKSAKVINEIVIISDGVETCDSDPVEAAKEAYLSESKVVVHVIGFAVQSTADNKALREISQVAGGTYATAPTIDELKLAMDLQWDNYVRRAKEDACRQSGYETFLSCRDQVLSLVNAYISSELSRDPRELSYEEKLKIDRLRYVVPAYMKGSLDTFSSPEPKPEAL